MVAFFGAGLASLASDFFILEALFLWIIPLLLALSVKEIAVLTLAGLLAFFAFLIAISSSELMSLFMSSLFFELLRALFAVLVIGILLLYNLLLARV